MHIEELIDKLVVSGINLPPYDSKILNSFSSQTFLGTGGLTEKQGQLAVRILTRYASQLSFKLNVDVNPYLENPQFKVKLRKIVNEKSVKIANNTIIAKFPYDDFSVGEIRKHKNKVGKYDNIVWDREQTAWVFPLNEENIQFVTGLCNSSSFEFDEDFTKYSNDCNDILNDLENYAPMLSLVNGKAKILNSPKNMPEIDTDDITDALFQARRLGVNLWTDDIEQYLNQEDFNPKVRDFLRNADGKEFSLSTEENDIFCLETIVKYLSPTIFVIPGGMEFDKLTHSHSILSGMGIANKNMSVLFRLPTETGRNFNEFVRNQGINEPISEDTKIVFVSGKLPKPLVKSKICFNSIINLGFDNAHYTLKTYLQNHPNLVYFNVKKNRGRF